jgi:flagellar export protein FliJ
MKKFEFRLEKLMEVRRQAEKVRRQRLADIQRDIARELAMLERLNGLKDDALDELRMRGLQEALDIPGVVDGICHLQVISKQIGAQKTVIDTLRREEAHRRQEVITARRDRKVAENLRNQAYAEYLQERARLEQRFLDEIGLVQYIKGGGDEISERSVSG